MENKQLSIHNDDKGEIFEVFQQDRRRDLVPHHGGNLCAPDPELAYHYAREFYGRRQESDCLWIIPRTHIWEISSRDTPTQSASHPLEINAAAETQQETIIALFGQPQAGKAFEWICDLPEPLHPAALTWTTLQAYMHECAQSYERFWFCPRTSIVELDSPDLLHPPLDRSYRRLDGYNIRDKLREARQRTLQAQTSGPQPQQHQVPHQRRTEE